MKSQSNPIQKSATSIIPVLKLVAFTLALLLLVALLTSCGQSGNNPSTGVPSKDTFPAFSDDQSSLAENDDFNAAANALYRLCHDQPEVLAATMSAFPRELKAAGISITDPIALDDAMDEDGTLQQTLLDLLKGILEAPHTKFAFTEWSGEVELLCIGLRDPELPVTPTNAMLFWETVTVEDAPLFAIQTSGDNPEDSEFGIFYLPGGFQRLEPVIDAG